MSYTAEYKLCVSYDEGVDPVATSELILACLSDTIRQKLPDAVLTGSYSELFRYTGRWYDCEKDLKPVARQFPGCSFVLHGKGEEIDDEWETEFRGNSVRYRSVSLRWSDRGSAFEGRYEPANYALYIDPPTGVKFGEMYASIIEWMKTNSADWEQTFNLNSERPVKSLESNGVVEWYGYAQMRDLAHAFPECSFELRCVPTVKGSEYIYRVVNDDESFKRTELVWNDWSAWQ